MKFDAIDHIRQVEEAADRLGGCSLYQACEVFLQESARCDIHGLPLEELMEELCGAADPGSQAAWSGCETPSTVVALCLSVYGYLVDYCGVIRDFGGLGHRMESRG